MKEITLILSPVEAEALLIAMDFTGERADRVLKSLTEEEIRDEDFPVEQAARFLLVLSGLFNWLKQAVEDAQAEPEEDALPMAAFKIGGNDTIN